MRMRGFSPGLESAIASARAHRTELLALPHVITVRGGYKFVGGRITGLPAVVVAVDHKREGLEATDAVPKVLSDGTPTDVSVADPLERLALAGLEAVTTGSASAAPPLLIDQLQEDEPLEDPVVELEAVPPITYVPPAGVSLAPVSGAMVVTCHVSPDAGWRVLRPFLLAAGTAITLGMYDFTAPHIYRAVRRLLRNTQVVWRQTLGARESLPTSEDIDSTKADDKPEASIIRGLALVAPTRFESAFAKTGAGRTFASAYHIKVAVRDRQATWLSSGNWQSSNQPVTDFLDADADRELIRAYNREWHLVVEHPGLAATLDTFLRHDFELASVEHEAIGPPLQPDLPDLAVRLDERLESETPPAPLGVFPPERFEFDEGDPLTIQPILTPDNYLEVILELLRDRPRQRLFFQNQSLNPVLNPTAAWAELLDLLASYSRDPSLDVRIIFRNIGPVRKKLESLQAAGFDMTRVRSQVGCHTKGIVIDSETVLLGSHNWTDQGVQVNRDASVLIRRPEIARYYERVFLHDWDRLARTTIREESMPIPVLTEDQAAELEGQAFRLVPWSRWEEE
jgi:hypothetical protein